MAVTELIPQSEPGSDPRPRRTVPPWLRPESPALVFLGVALVALGTGMVGYTWLRVSGLLSVPLQLPYVASSGLTGLGLVVLGSLVVNLSTKRRDAAARSRQLDELSGVLASIASAIDDRSRAGA